MSPIRPEEWREVSPHLDFALTLSREEQARWLATFRVERPDLAGFLEKLLEEHSALAEEHFLEHEPLRPANDSSLAGQILGAYRLVSRVGDGGMGSVWRAERVDGRFEREVAVKFLHFALASRGAERFKREGRILGHLAHPHIAELIDAGVTSDAQPYLVLEYVSGKQIDEYCDEHTLEVDGRIALFLDVLDAVEHAHANLVVHRDIKPSNVLVSSEGDVKLLDFGIAKLLAQDGDSIGATMLTLEDGSAMTPLFAAPEQLTGGAITTATDVYSLGLLLYLLLTGNHPAGTGPHSPADLLKSITEVDAPLASKMILLNGVASAERRGTTAEKLHRRLRGDLDTILAKALKKKPAERYASVAAFADDLGRYIANEPVSARPESASYRLRKYVRRHRFGAALTAGIALLLLGFLVIQGIELRRITLERDRADRIANFMTGIFQVSDPNEGNGQGVTAREVLDKAANDIDSNLSQDPQLQAQMLNVMGRAYLNLGLFSRAESLFKKGIETSKLYRGQDSRETLHTTHDMAWAIFQQGRVSEAESIERNLLDRQRRMLGSDDTDTIATIEELAFTVCDEGKGQCSEGVDLTRDVLNKQKRALGPNAFSTLGTMDNLAIMLAEVNRYDEALEIQKESLEKHMRVFGPDNIGTIGAVLNLGEMQRNAGQVDEAMGTFQDLLQRERRVLAPDQGETAATEYDLASVLLLKGQKEKALSMLRESIAGGLAPRLALGLPIDPLFTSLRKDPHFTAIVAQAQKEAGSQKPN